MLPRLPDSHLADRALATLERVVAVDSQSDEASTTLPTTEGQRVLADLVAEFHRSLGATVERDEHANVLAWYPGRGALANARPYAFLVHLDTARGTAAIPRLHVLPRWSGEPVPYPKNPSIRVDLATFPAAAPFAGQDLVYGDGEVPFGLDDKLGLAQCLTLAAVLREHPDVPHPPLVFVGRPDEEVGRHEAVVGLAALFAERGVAAGYTIDGIWPFEVNVENFEAAVTSVTFASRPAPALAGATLVARIGGVNTHGATAAAEGHRTALRLCAEWRAAMPAGDAQFVAFESDALRDCDALVHLVVAPGAEARVRAALEATMAPHVPRGASFSLEAGGGVKGDGNVEAMLAWLRYFYVSNPGFTLPAEESSGRDGYSHPFRARAGQAGLRLDVRLRDFDPVGLERRIEHVRALAGEHAFDAKHQYVNMGPRLAAHPELVAHALAAAAEAGVPAFVQPIRGGTGVDPFLDKGVPVANLGTGYFSPESEKEFTSKEMMARHVRWLFALVQRLG